METHGKLHTTRFLNSSLKIGVMLQSEYTEVVCSSIVGWMLFCLWKVRNAVQNAHLDFPEENVMSSVVSPEGTPFTLLEDNIWLIEEMNSLSSLLSTDQFNSQSCPCVQRSLSKLVTAKQPIIVQWHCTKGARHMITNRCACAFWKNPVGAKISQVLSCKLSCQ